MTVEFCKSEEYIDILKKLKTLYDKKSEFLEEQGILLVKKKPTDKVDASLSDIDEKIEALGEQIRSRGERK